MSHTPEFPPLTPLSMHLLLALAEGDRHGYALMQAVRQQSGGTVRPGTGSLYAAVQRLVDDDLITVVTGDDSSSGRRGNTYRLTSAGRRAAGTEVERMRAMLNLASDRKIISEAEGG